MARISVTNQAQWNWFRLIPRNFIFEPFLDLRSLLDPILDQGPTCSQLRWVPMACQE